MDLDAALQLLAQEPAAPLDLAQVALLLARDEYPDLDVDAYLSELDGMAHEARRYLRGDLEARVTGLCRYLFHEMGFHGNTRDYYDARNSYLNDVLEQRTGIPITLSAVAIAVGCRAGLEVVGVGLPGHFVAKAMLDGRSLVFDPFHGGRHLSREQCEQLVQQITSQPFEAGDEALEATPLARVLERMLTNLKGIYLRGEDFERAVRVIERLRQLAPNDAVQRRDLGAALLNGGRPGQAIDHLAAYLEAVPDGTDAPMIRQLLAKARGEVAKWN